MANTITSPNMGMPVPVPGVDPGVDWANNIVADMSIIDSHNHSPGQGVPITPSGMSISADLPFNGNNATTLRSARFSAQGSPLALATDLGCLYEAGVDLYYNDGAGNQVRITQSGSVTGSTGTITGLPSGTASASYSAGTFIFQGATNTPATMNIGPIVTGAATVGSKNVTISASGSQPSNYALTLPTALPAADAFLGSDNSGNMAFLGGTGFGLVVQQSSATLTSPTINTPTINTPTINTPTISSPTFSGTSSGIIASGTYTPTLATTVGSGGIPVYFSYIRINDRVNVTGSITSMVLSASDWVGTITLPIDPSSNFAVSQEVNGVLGVVSASSINIPICFNYVTAAVGTKTARATLFLNGSTSSQVTVNFSYSCA